MSDVIGIGFRSGASAEAIGAALSEALAEGAALAVATAEDKARHPGLASGAAALGLSIIAVPRAAIEAAAPHLLTCSMRSSGAGRGGSLSEAAALAAAGGGARLTAPRRVHAGGQVTTARARRP